jgi:hypothetical protein
MMESSYEAFESSRLSILGRRTNEKGLIAKEDAMNRQNKGGRNIFTELREGVCAMGKHREGIDQIDRLQTLPKRVSRSSKVPAVGTASFSVKGKAKKGFNSRVLSRKSAD